MRDLGEQNTTSKEKKVLVEEGLFVIPSSPSDEPHLIGSQCQVCGEVAFPKQTGCPNCCSENVEEIQFGAKGKLYSFTNVNHPVPSGYSGPIPYGIGMVDLPEGPRIVAYLTESDPDRLRVGMDVVLVIDKLLDDEEGNEIIGFKYKPS